MNISQKSPMENPILRLLPIFSVNSIGGLKKDLDYTHTRHRYPWLCSLRTRGDNPGHLCGVTLLSVPPDPTVIVGAAHCTYLCKDTDDQGVSLPSCCCVSRGQESCAENKDRCGTQPRAVEMNGKHVEIVCGEWETGPTTMEISQVCNHTKRTENSSRLS